VYELCLRLWRQAIDHDQPERDLALEVGAVSRAGYQTYRAELSEYGFGRYPDVISA
jgi:heterodisulfide reductase subunit A-like polyferredoxin